MAVAGPNERYLYSTVVGEVFETYRTGVFADAGIALLRLNEYARRASGEKKDFRLAGPAKASTDRARLLYLQALAHLHSYLIAVSPGGRTYFFERLLLYAESASKLNGIVGLLASGVGHFFLIGDTEKCRETRRILLAKWNLFSADADIAPFMASHRNRLISFADSAKVRLFVDCLIGLSEELPIEHAPQEPHGREVRTTRDALREAACSVALGRAADSDCVKADDSLVSWERRADLLG